MFLQDVKLVTTPESTRATNIPNSSPDTMMESEAPRRWAGAKSPTRGIISCGVTVVAPQINETTRKARKDFVTHKTIHCVRLAWILGRGLKGEPH